MEQRVAGRLKGTALDIGAASGHIINDDEA